MPKEDSILDTKIKYRGVFDLEVLYLKLRDWLMREGYADPCEFGEKKYSEKIKPNGKQVEIVWETSKSEEGDYFKIVMKLSFYVVGLSEVEVERDGKNIKLDKAEVEIKFSSSLVRNANESWDENSLFYKIYEKYILGNSKIDEFRIATYKDTTDLVDEAKNFLNLYTL